jgi:D-alanine-D-alanine ligase
LKELVLKPSSGPHFDVVFPVVHGTLCEDGTLQGLLEISGLPYVGCGVLSSAIGMDKDISKRLAMQAGMNVAPYLVIKRDQWLNCPDYCAHQIAEKIGYPVFTKPANTGSSIGINKIKTPDQLHAAINEAFQFDTKVLIEKALDVIELEVAVLEAIETIASPIVSVVGEIRPTHEFYSYDAKYLDENGANLFIPAPIADEVKGQAQSVAKKLFLTLECEGMARVDLFLTKDTQQIYFNEINTIPGFTQISMYPKLMEASGVPYSELLTHLVQLAIKRHKDKNQLVRSYTD